MSVESNFAGSYTKIDEFGDYFGSAKVFVEQYLHISGDALHVLLSVMMLIGFAAVIRTSIDRLTPWTFVLVFQLLNELNDLRAMQWSNLAFELGESAKDITLTMLVPTILFLLTRFRPDLLTRQHSPKQASSSRED